MNFDVTMTSICSLVKLVHVCTKRFSETILVIIAATPKTGMIKMGMTKLFQATWRAQKESFDPTLKSLKVEKKPVMFN